MNQPAAAAAAAAAAPANQAAAVPVPPPAAAAAAPAPTTPVSLWIVRTPWARAPSGLDADPTSNVSRRDDYGSSRKAEHTVRGEKTSGPALGTNQAGGQETPQHRQRRAPGAEEEA